MKTAWLSSRHSLLESILALVAGFLALLAAIWPQWLESFGVRLDNGSGALEWIIPMALALIAIVFGVRAARRWHIAFAK